VVSFFDQPSFAKNADEGFYFKQVKMKNILLWTGILFTAFIFGSAGTMKAFGIQQMHQNMQALNYPSWFTYLLGVAELVGVAGLFFKRWRMPVVILFFAVLFGGLASHITAGHGIDRIAFALAGFISCSFIVATDGSLRHCIPLLPKKFVTLE
jgi:DoxX-like family